MRRVTLVAATVMAAGFIGACGDGDDDLPALDPGITTTIPGLTTTTDATPTTGGQTTTTAAGQTTTTAGAPPVSITGTVNNRGTRSVSGNQVEMQLGDFYFEPTYVQGDAGAQVTVRLRNTGEARHTFTISSQNVDAELEAGAERTVQVTMPSGAEPLVFICRFHESRGMRGAFFTER